MQEKKNEKNKEKLITNNGRKEWMKTPSVREPENFFLKRRTNVSANTFPNSKDHSSLSQRQVAKDFHNVSVLQNRQKDSLQTIYPKIAPKMMSIKNEKSIHSNEKMERSNIKRIL